jgi:hypothetical protein
MHKLPAIRLFVNMQEQQLHKGTCVRCKTHLCIVLLLNGCHQLPLQVIHWQVLGHCKK